MQSYIILFVPLGLFIFSKSNRWYSSAIEFVFVLIGSNSLFVSLNLGLSFMNGCSMPVRGKNTLFAALLIF